MKNLIDTMCYAALLILLIFGDRSLGFAQDEHTVALYTFETGTGKTVTISLKPLKTVGRCIIVAVPSKLLLSMTALLESTAAIVSCIMMFQTLTGKFF